MVRRLHHCENRLRGEAICLDRLWELGGRRAGAYPEFFVHVDSWPLLHLLNPPVHLDRVSGQIGSCLHAGGRIVARDGVLLCAGRGASRFGQLGHLWFHCLLFLLLLFRSWLTQRRAILDAAPGHLHRRSIVYRDQILRAYIIGGLTGGEEAVVVQALVFGGRENLILFLVIKRNLSLLSAAAVFFCQVQHAVVQD